MAEEKPNPGAQMNIRFTDEDLKGRYSNLVHISYSLEEFVLDFINRVPPQPVVTARVITSPSHLKRLARTLAKNIDAYEQKYGPIPEIAESPITGGDPIN